MICGKESHKHRGQICVRPAGHLIDQHHSATGKYWWYSVDDRDRLRNGLASRA